VFNCGLEIASVIVESEMLHTEEDEHQQIAEESRGHTCEHDHDPEDRRESGVAIAGDVRLLRRPPTGGDTPLDKRRRDAQALALLARASTTTTTSRAIRHWRLPSFGGRGLLSYVVLLACPEW
jgi:hypothetical protein